jgi:hypothetical protein
LNQRNDLAVATGKSKAICLNRCQFNASLGASMIAFISVAY